MVSTCASGTKAVRYGTMKHNVLSLKVVVPNGQLVKTGNRARKSSAGYDLTHLFVGSEGTLGIVVEVTLRVYKIPEFEAAVLVCFPTIGDAANVASEIMMRDITLGMVELMDDLMMKAINQKFKFHYEEKPTLYLEFSGGSQAQLEFQAEVVKTISKKYGGGKLYYAASQKEREELWKARKAALFASTVLRPGADVLTTDVCVPVSRLPECIIQTHDDLKHSFLLAPLVGHVGDGNFHLFVLLDPLDKKDVAEAKRLNQRLVDRALKMDGTCTGEHGVGVGKRVFLEKELGREAIELMRVIKKAIDPNNLMNPGKIFPDNISPQSITTQGVSIIQDTYSATLEPSKISITFPRHSKL